MERTPARTSASNLAPLVSQQCVVGILLLLIVQLIRWVAKLPSRRMEWAQVGPDIME
jgi:hypothetical protein